MAISGTAEAGIPETNRETTGTAVTNAADAAAETGAGTETAPAADTAETAGIAEAADTAEADAATGTAEAAGADYLGVGAVFSTTTKTDACEVARESLKEICAAVHIPVVAIGGINKGNIGQLIGTGVDGVALVSAIFAAGDIESECRELRMLSEKIVTKG